MNVTSMLSRLRDRLEDPNDRTWDDDKKLDALRDAELLLVSEIDNAYLTKELETEKTETFTGLGGIAVIPLPGDVANGEISSIVRAENVLVTWRTVERAETVRYTNPLLAPSSNEPIGFIEGGNFYSMLASDVGKSAKIFYLRNPKQMVEENPLSYQTDTSELNEVLHPILLLKAESICWDMDDEGTRSTKAENKADKAIALLNKKHNWK